MKIINYISTLSIPLIITGILIVGIKEKKNVYDLFIKGAKDGIKIVIGIFPTILAIFIAVGALRNSGTLNFVISMINIIVKKIKFPTEILPLAILKPISGSASIAIATDIMKTYGVDSKIGKIASTIMGSTETTFYIIAIYTSSIKIKKTKTVFFIALIADFICIMTSVLVWQIIN